MNLQTSQVVGQLGVDPLSQKERSGMKIEKLLTDLHLGTNLSSKDIPDLDLYMDQVIQLFENKFEAMKRTPEEKILTKTMINNYSKGKLFFPIKNKKYSREHIMLMNMIYEMKTVLSIRDIKQAVTKLNADITENAFDLETFYKNYLESTEINAARFQENSIQLSEEAVKSSQAFDDKQDAYYEKLLLILSFVNMSNYYRRAAEKMIDQIEETEPKKD